MDYSLKIDCFLSQGCQSETTLKENIGNALSKEGQTAQVQVHRISDEEALSLGLTGSPSILVNGIHVLKGDSSGLP